MIWEPRLILVRFDDCEIPDWDIGGGRTLTSLQQADVFGDHSDEGAAQLVAALLLLLVHCARRDCGAVAAPYASTRERAGALRQRRHVPSAARLRDLDSVVAQVHSVRCYATVLEVMKRWMASLA